VYISLRSIDNGTTAQALAGLLKDLQLSELERPQPARSKCQGRVTVEVRWLCEAMRAAD
jgi:hypothetical protein